MKLKNYLLLALFILITLQLSAQGEQWFYATMETKDAQSLLKDFPSEIKIIENNGEKAAVQLSEKGGHELHERVLVHGPGYIFRANLTDALKALETPTAVNKNTMAYSITENATVAQALDVIDTQNIEDHIIELENYGTRYHDRPQATQAATDLKTKWEQLAAAYNRNDVTVRLYNHINTNMPSVIMTIEGSESPDEYVIVGGHLDSTANPSHDDAPGADDDASGIATITEATRALFEIGFVPNRTIEVMAYAAEEIGLVGSAEIASDYANQNINVTAVAQFDMTNYQGSTEDVAFITDHTDATLNDFLMNLADTYNASGAHQFTYTTSVCNYGCSDHSSWTDAGYMSTFPFEAKFGEHNPNIHSPNDTFAFVGTATHATKFAKLCAEYLIETAKSANLGVNSFATNSVVVFVKDRSLYFLSNNSSSIEKLEIFDSSGREIFEVKPFSSEGSIDVNSLSSGFYIARLGTERGNVAKKFIVN